MKRWQSLPVLVAIAAGARADDPLPSWNDVPAKRAIVGFVSRTTQGGSPDFVPLAERVAVFDNDGTLWPENPAPFQFAFVLDELKRLAPERPEWKEDKIIQAAIQGDVAVIKEGGLKAIAELTAATHSGMTTDEFSERVRNWLRSSQHPRYGRPYDKLAYQPMLEVLNYLRANGYKTFIVSGGGADFMRVFAEEVYGVPPEHVIGSYGKTKFELRGGAPVLVKEPAIELVDDKEGKPVGIHRFIGRRPIVCFGNSDGDKAMLEWTTLGRKPSLGLIVHHTDAEREYAYDQAPKSSGKLIEALAEAASRGWIVVDMSSDWSRLFASDK